MERGEPNRALLYVGLYPNPATAPVEVHLFFFGTTLAAFYAIPATIDRCYKRLDPLPETTETLSVPVES